MTPSIGRIVHYVLGEGPAKGQHRPAIIARVWPDTGKQGGTLQLQVFPDSDREGAFNDCLPVPFWATSVVHDENGKRPDTWHWPEQVE